MIECGLTYRLNKIYPVKVVLYVPLRAYSYAQRTVYIQRIGIAQLMRRLNDIYPRLTGYICG